MPAAKGQQADPEKDEPAAAAPEPSAYEYTAGFDTVYLAVPLTAHPERPAVPGDDDTPAVPAQPATVYAWPDGPPEDGRWQPTRKKPNQAPDNAGPAITEE